MRRDHGPGCRRPECGSVGHGRRGLAPATFSREERQRYREKVQLCLDVFERMLGDVHLRRERAADRAGGRAQPRRRTTTSPTSATPPCWRRSPTRRSRPSWAPTTSSSTCRRARSTGDAAPALEDDLRASLNARRGAGPTGAARHIVMVGILPTLMTEHLSTAPTG